MATIKTRVMSVTTEIKMTPGERQALWVLTTLQYLVEIGPKSPPAGQITQSVQSIMQPLQQVEISFMPHAVLGYATLTQLRGTSGETDISCADILITLQCGFSWGHASTGQLTLTWGLPVSHGRNDTGFSKFDQSSGARHRNNQEESRD